ncbi:MAG: hypothetical protein K2O14_10840, partial [Oscillospiraceae bacterium]|nr:hypothetical protein [Oscillospiraceae bacterium]
MAKMAKTAKKKAKKRHGAPRKNIAQAANRNIRTPERAASPAPSGGARPAMGKPSLKPNAPSK